jgi:hypothetical protein
MESSKIVKGEAQSICEIKMPEGQPRGWTRTCRVQTYESFAWPCDFYGERTTVSPGGHALVLDLRSSDEPGSHTANTRTSPGR